MTKTYISALEKNSEDVYLETTSIFVKLMDHIIEDPTNSKYRNLQLSNAVLTNKLLPASGARECLLEMGFQQGEDSLILPDSIPIENLKRIRDEIFSSRNDYKNRTSESGTAKEEASSTTSSLSKRQVKVKTQIQRRIFLQKVARTFQSVLRYEDKDLQAKALAVIPLADLQKKAEEKMQRQQTGVNNGETNQEADIQEFILLELMSWYQTFFSWVDSCPNCSFCGGKTELKRCTVGELDGGEIGKTEVFLCDTCQKETLFPRYNNPGKLLETRKGRCGEWANCLTLLFRACSWDARFVLDETDHVWAEVYSEKRKRWIHCDPGNKYDTPLMYEAGWGKKLTYVLAYSKDEVQDVTWRYSRKHQEVMSRRTLCREEELNMTIMQLRQERQRNMSEAERQYLNSRFIDEIVEFLTQQPTE